MNNEIIFTEIETIKVTVYKTDNCHCPVFRIESNNHDSNISDIIEDTLKLYYTNTC